MNIFVLKLCYCLAKNNKTLKTFLFLNAIELFSYSKEYCQLSELRTFLFI